LGHYNKKYKIERKISDSLDFKADINLISYVDLKNIFPYSPILQNQFEYSKLVYGKLSLPRDIIINRLYLFKKLLDVEYIIEVGKDLDGKYIYNGIRSCLSIRMFINNVIDSKLIIKTIESNIGRKTAESLRKNKTNYIQKDISLRYLKYLYKKLEGELRWAKKQN
jgi:hypothetical protein